MSELVLGSVVVATMAGCSFKPQTEKLPTLVTPTPDGATTVGAFDGPVRSTDSTIPYVPDSGPGTGPTADANCGNLPFVVATRPPDLLIVLDRSGSMDQDINGRTCGAGCISKWTQVTAAINQVVAATESSVNWGLKVFPNDNNCGVVAGAEVPPGPNNAAAIAAAIVASVPGNQTQTPTTAAELSAGEYMATITDTNRKFVLLATDGQPNCRTAATGAGGRGGGGAMTDDPAAIQAVATVAAMGFPTFVIGIATGGSTADGTLSSMAMNGGYPTGGTPQYYSVASTAELTAALATIQGVIGGTCTYAIGTPGEQADVGTTTVTVDGVKSPQGDPNGWHFDFEPGKMLPTSVTFTGTTCEALKAGTASKVQVLFGCSIVII